MLFVLIYAFCVFWFLLFSKYERNIVLDTFCFLSVFLLLWFIPSLQYGVGTDYFNYIRIFDTPTELDYYYRKYEYAFYYLVVFLNYLGLSSQSLFVSVGLIQILLFLNFIRVAYPRYPYVHIALVFSFFFFVTNVFHNQLNVLRAYVAVLFFMNAYVYFIRGKNSLSILMFMIGLIWHKSIIFTLPLFLLRGRLGFFVVKNVKLMFIITLMLFGSGILYQFIDVIVGAIAPMYKHYLNAEREKNVSLIQLATRLYNYPFYFLFIYYLSKSDISKFRKVDISLIAVWVVTINSALFVFYFGRFSRLFYFFAPFMFVPFYYLYVLNKKNLVYLAIVYTLFGYCLKVIAFPSAEYDYSSIIFN
ncbi:EpsG family protein [uncultured Vibrio sp.]|uniref:EpsG family protein n=1 Tax=uncultured Vibrio sp. TaxID=114054 RepID=UPI003748419C